MWAVCGQPDRWSFQCNATQGANRHARAWITPNPDLREPGPYDFERALAHQLTHFLSGEKHLEVFIPVLVRAVPLRSSDVLETFWTHY